ncbi:unnamed protein product [Camellia sinensis]
MRTVFGLKEFGVDVVYEEEQKQAGAQDKAYPFNCPESLYLVRTRSYILSNQVPWKDNILASLSCPGWHKYVLQASTETTDVEEEEEEEEEEEQQQQQQQQQKHHKSDQMGKAAKMGNKYGDGSHRGPKAVVSTSLCENNIHIIYR